MSEQRTQGDIVHFVPSEKAKRALQPICGYVRPDDEVSRDPKACTCPECLDWITAPCEASGAGVTGHD